MLIHVNDSVRPPSHRAVALLLACLQTAVVLAFIGVPESLRAQAVSAHQASERDSTRHVHPPDPRVTMVVDGDTVMWMRANATNGKMDTATFLVRPDSAWLLIHKRRVAMTAYRADMLRRAVESNKRAITLDSTLGMPKR